MNGNLHLAGRRAPVDNQQEGGVGSCCLSKGEMDEASAR